MTHAEATTKALAALPSYTDVLQGKRRAMSTEQVASKVYKAEFKHPSQARVASRWLLFHMKKAKLVGEYHGKDWFKF